MSDIVQVVTAISNLFLQTSPNFGLPPLTEGAILFGREFVDQTGAPPRIVFVPTIGQYGPPSMNPTGTGVADRNRLRSRMLWREITNFEVHIWGYDPENPTLKQASVQIVQQMTRALLICCFSLTSIDIQPKRFEWVSQAQDAITREGHGEYFVMMLELHAPITDHSVNFAPPGTKARVVVNPGSQ